MIVIIRVFDNRRDSQHETGYASMHILSFTARCIPCSYDKERKKEKKSSYDGSVRGNVRNGLKPVLPRIMNGLPPPYGTITWLVTSRFIAAYATHAGSQPRK